MQRENLPLITVGLDIGYGVVKAITDQAVVTFPSVWGHAHDIKWQADETAQKYPGDQITDEDGSWFVGDLALSQIAPGQLLKLRGRTANESELGNVSRVRLARVALGKLLPGKTGGSAIHVRIATGLPVDHMRDAPELKQALIGQHLIQTDSTEFVANITEVMVMPQPYGTIYANTLTDSGQVNACHTYQRTGVCDVGTYTVDLALDDDGEYVDSESGSVEAGVWTAQQRIAAAIERDYRQKPTYKVVEEVLRSACLVAHGKSVNYREEVEEALEPLRSATVALMSERWQTGLNVGVIYLSGGGASLVFKQVKHLYPQSQLVDNAQLANARGYLNYALFQAQQ